MLNNEKKIYALCPANIATGGPELLHQLVYHLRNELKLNAYMFYYPNIRNPIHDEYKNYNNPYVNEIIDEKENVLIIPEMQEYIDVSNKYKLIKKYIWWLSIDNYYSSLPGYKKKINRSFLKRNLPNHNFFDKSLVNFDLHLVQSYYAYEHLKQKNISNIMYLSDYLNSDFLNIETDINLKENIVVYNPKKGYEFTSQIIKKAKNLEFIAIENMTRVEVIDLLKRAKVYIDFGFHPGKDRIPREAAILKCCVITGMKGSAKNKKDIMIPEFYKFYDKKKNINSVIKKIEDCFINYDKCIEDFEDYINKIKNEKVVFLDNISEVFYNVKYK